MSELEFAKLYRIKSCQFLLTIVPDHDGTDIVAANIKFTPLELIEVDIQVPEGETCRQYFERFTLDEARRIFNIAAEAFGVDGDVVGQDNDKS
jgi:hypothetical protein